MLESAASSQALGIWPPEWSQFIPDVLVAVLTGLVIGIALDRVQLRRSRRDDQRDAEKSWDRLKSRLRDSFESPLTTSASMWLDSAPLQRILKEIEDCPLQDWARQLQDPTLDALIRLEHNIGRVLRSAEILTERAELSVRGSRPENVPEDRLNERHREATWAVRSIAMSLDLQRIPMGSNDLPEEELLMWASEVLADQRVREPLEQFLTALNSVSRDYQTVVDAFRLADGLR